MQRGVLARVSVLTALVCFLCGCASSADHTLAATTQAPVQHSPWNFPGNTQPPHLIAHYMPWYETPMGPSAGPWNHWKWPAPGAPAAPGTPGAVSGKVDHDPQRRRPDGRRDIASVVYPLIGPYDSSSPQVIRYHLATAKAAGVEGLALIWYGPMDRAIDARVSLILDEALKQNLRIAICYEEKICFPPYRSPKSRQDIVSAAVGDLAYILKHYATHPAYLRRENRPFIFQFNSWGVGRIGPKHLTPDEWRDVFARLARMPGSEPILYGREKLDEIHHPPIESAYIWWSPDTSWLEHFGRRAAALRDAGRLTFFMTMVSPGFDDTGVWGWGAGPNKSERYGLDVLRQTWDIAWRNDPELIQIVTWNDFNEATVVEPTVEHGYTFLDAIETWLGQRTGRKVNLADNRAPLRELLNHAGADQRREMPQDLSPYQRPPEPSPRPRNNPVTL